jgi:hypothetical protein
MLMNQYLLNRVPIFSLNIKVKSPSEKKMRMSNNTTLDKVVKNKKVKKSISRNCITITGE